MDVVATISLLSEGDIHIEGRLVDASNATFYCTVAGRDGSETPDDDESPARVVGCVYKPIRGERPLDDFPPGTLAYRERAAYLLSEATGWGIVPPTVLRNGPFGEGMVQLWVDPDPQADVLQMILAPDPRLRRVAVYDVLANNADRKGSHLLPLPDGRIHGVDHGICFAVQPKLRTVLWAWRGQPLDKRETDAVARVAQALEGPLGRELEDILSPAEVRATADRAARLLEAGRLPQPDPTRPAIPWPPF